MTSEIVVHDKHWAERITERLRLQSTIFADSRNKIIELLHEAQDGDAARLLGYKSWTAYISDVFGEQPLRLEKDLRREFVKELSSEGMSTRAIAPIVGVDHATAVRDLQRGAIAPPVESTSSDYSVSAPDFEDDTKLSPIVSVEHHDIVEPVDMGTGEILEDPEPSAEPEPKPVTGLDGKTYQRAVPSKPRRNPITDQFTHRTVELTRLVDSFTRLIEDDRFDTNKKNIAATNGSDIKRAVDALSKVLDALRKE